MSDQNNERKLDDLLDSALTEYSAVEPRPGLEGRILARVRDAAEQPRARWWTFRWVAIGALAAMIALIVLSVLLRPVPKPSHGQVPKETPGMNQTQPGSTDAIAKVKPLRPKRNMQPRLQPVLARRDRPAVFPTPMDLSEQEKLMLAYIAQTPKEEIIAQMRPPSPEEEEEFWKDPQPAVTRPQR
jgi:hypothetical protein